MNISEKVTYVKKAEFVRGHKCHWRGCTVEVPPAMSHCRLHWYKLPISLRNKVWATYKPGQEITKTPSAKYIGVIREVLTWIKANAN